MTTQDPRYKHKPSEKHTLEEVLKSLQDLIRNDLPGEKSAGHKPEASQAGADAGGQKTPETGGQKLTSERIPPVREDFAPVNPAAGPVNLDAVMRSLKDLIGNELDVGDQPRPEEPAFEEPDELNLGDDLATPEEDLTPPLPEEGILESAAEALAPLHEEPTFEEPDELNLGDDLITPEQELTPPLPEEDILETAAEAPAPQREEPGFEESVDLDFSTEIELPEETPAPPQAEPTTEDGSAIEFVSPDEELTLEEMAEAAPPSAEEIPEEMSSELVAEPVIATPSPAPKPAGEEKIAAGAQQELLFEEPVPLIIERQPPIRDIEKEAQRKPEPAVENAAPGVPAESAAQNLETPDAGKLPTIEVEETFDESAYFDVDEPQAESPPPEEIAAPAIEPAAAPDTTPTESADIAGEKPGSAVDMTPEPEPEPTPAKTELKLEIADETVTETPHSASSVDFDSIDLTASVETPAPSSVPVEPAAAASEPSETEQSIRSMPSIEFESVSPAPEKDKQALSSPSETAPPAPASEAPAATETPAVAESTPEVTMMKKPAPDEIKKETVTEPEKAPEEKAAEPASTGEKDRPTPAPERGSAVKPPAFNLDDIPVLHEVVAPPAGSMLTPPPVPPQAPLPAPDRARDIVVRAVAKLNVELRKSGGAGLDTKTILRLQKLMRQELEKDGKK